MVLFKKDSWFIERAAVFKIDTETIKSFSDVLGFLNPDTGIMFTASSFCVFGFSNGKVKIHFVSREYMRYNHSRHLQLGFELPVKKESLPFFYDKEIFYLGKYKNGITR